MTDNTAKAGAAAEPVDEVTGGGDEGLKRLGITTRQPKTARTERRYERLERDAEDRHARTNAENDHVQRMIERSIKDHGA